MGERSPILFAMQVYSGAFGVLAFEEWCGRRDLNPGPPAWEAGVLVQARRRPLRIVFVCVGGFRV